MEIFSFGLPSFKNASSDVSVELLGGKGHGLVYLNSIGVPTTPGFIIPTNVCVDYFANPTGTMQKVEAAIEPLLADLAKAFGYMPLLSVRSGARKSMPGMMDTILNVGLDEDNARAWVERIGKPCVIDSRRRLIEMFGSVVKGIDRDLFHGLDSVGARNVYVQKTGEAFPKAKIQLLNSIEAVFRSWNNERAQVYRKLNNIPDSWGTAVTVMAMCFGNFNDKSGTGVLFTRNPDSGEKVVTGEFLENAQGEDVVAGIRTPMPLGKMKEWNPAVYEQLINIVLKLEEKKRDVQDVEFTIQDGKLFILQTRTAKRSAGAAVRIAVDMQNEGLINTTELQERVTFRQYLLAQSPTVDPTFKEPAFAVGLPACSGVVTGVVVHSNEAAQNTKGCILVRDETTPDDIKGMLSALGVLTMTGGATSHAAVVARAMNKPTVVGLGKKETEFPEGSVVSICGATGRVWKCPVPTVKGKNLAVKQFEDKVSACNVFTPVHIVTVGNRLLAEVVEEIKALDSFADKPIYVDLRQPNKKAIAAFDMMFPEASKQFSEQDIADDLLKKCKNKILVFITDEKIQGPGGPVMTSFEDICSSTAKKVNADISGLSAWQREVLSWRRQATGRTVVGFGYGPGSDFCYSIIEAMASKLATEN